MENKKILIHQNLIKYCPMTTEDINLVNRMFGPDISTLKGWSTCTKPFQSIYDYIKIPKALISSDQLLDLAINGMFINAQPMLTTIYRSIKYRFFLPLDNRTSEYLYHGLDNLPMHYNITGFLWNEFIVMSNLNQ